MPSLGESTARKPGRVAKEHRPFRNQQRGVGRAARLLRGPAADFDLYQQRWNGFRWVIVARSESVTAAEQIAYSGTWGYYRWRVYSFSGSGGYSLWLQHP
jgi:hypothetical protein